MRYTHAKRRTHFISFISLTSMLGIALGVTALITVLSVMNGFEGELRDRILGMASHASVTTFDGYLADWQDVEQAVMTHGNVVAAAPYVSGETMLSAGNRVSGAIIRGILPEQEGAVSDVVSHIKAGSVGSLKDGDYGIILGSELAYTLGVGLGDAVTVVSPQVMVGPTGVMPTVAALHRGRTV